MKSPAACGLLFAALAVAALAPAQEKGKKTIKERVILLLDVNTKGLPKGAKIAQVEVVKGGGKRELKDVTTAGKPQPRLVGIFEVRTCNLQLTGGKVLEGREVLVAIDVGKQTLRDVRFVETCEGQTPQGAGRWHAYTAEYAAEIE